MSFCSNLSCSNLSPCTLHALTVLVTGGTGYIGSHTSVQLADAGFNVVLFDNLHNSSVHVLSRLKQLTQKPEAIHFVKGDLCNQHDLNMLFREHNFDFCIHFAALRFVGESKEQPWTYYNNNLLGALNLLQRLRAHHCKRVIFSSSGTVYGDQSSPLDESMDIGKGITNPYSVSKCVIEQMLRDMFYADPSWQIATLRYFNPVGAHPSGLIGEDPNGTPTSLFPYALQVLTGRLAKLTVFGSDFPTKDGTCVRDFVHVVDVARAHVSALEWLRKHPEGVMDVFNVGTGKGFSVLEVLAAMEQATGKTFEYDIGPRRPGDLPASYCNPDKIKSAMGWEASFSLEEMCAHAWKWQTNNPMGYTGLAHLREVSEPLSCRTAARLESHDVLASLGLRLVNGVMSHLPDVQKFLQLLGALRSSSLSSLPEDPAELLHCASLFAWGGSATGVVVARAPGRLDLMGGIADYSGALVLQMPIKEACFAAVQWLPQASGKLRIVSLGAVSRKRGPVFEIDLEDLLEGSPNGGPLSYSSAQELFKRDAATSWAAYVAGVFLVLAREKGVKFPLGGIRVLLSSQVPEGKGVSSSAAVEVASLMAISGAFKIDVSDTEVAELSQKVENLVVGAPCGIMDQMTAALGEEGKLLCLLCQPHTILGTIEIPRTLGVWGVDSGIQHNVGGADYGCVRTATFMGKRLLERNLGGIEYLANLNPSVFDCHSGLLPVVLSGEEFTNMCPEGTGDPVTQVKPSTLYHIRQCASHPVAEHFRVRSFQELLSRESAGTKCGELLGELMYQSHQSYSKCGLGSEGTDKIVNMVKHMDGLFGAKITGGGSGGTVAILGPAHSREAIDELVTRYETETQHRPYVFTGSSIGAVKFGHLEVAAA